MKIREKSKHENKLYKKKIKHILQCTNVNDILHRVDESDLNDSVMKYVIDSDSSVEITSVSKAKTKSNHSAKNNNVPNINKVENNKKQNEAKHPKRKMTNGSDLSNVKNHKPKAIHSQQSSPSDIGMIGAISDIVSSKNQSVLCTDDLYSNNDDKAMQIVHCDTTDISSKINNFETFNSKKPLDKDEFQFNFIEKNASNGSNSTKKKNKKTKKEKKKCKELLSKNTISKLKKIPHERSNCSENNDNSRLNSVSLLKVETKNKSPHNVNLAKTHSKLSTRIKVPQILLNTDYAFYSPEEHINYHHSVVELFDKTPVNKEVSFHTVGENTFNDIAKENLTQINKENHNINPETSDMDVTEKQDDIHNLKSLLTFDNELQLLDKLEKDFKLYELSNFCILTLKNASKVCFCGKMKVSLLFGRVEVLGHNLDDKFCELYSVNGFSLLNFETLPNKGNLDDLRSKLMKYDVPSSIVDDIFTDIVAGDALLIMKPITNVLTQFISKHLSNCDIFSNIKSTPNTNNQYSTLLQSSFYTGNYSGVFTKNDSWNDTIDSITLRLNKNLRNSILFCGGKNAGKSTMMRYTINRILNHGPVLVIDLDPGQPEFTICGVISATVVENSLLGPNFTHLKRPIRSNSLGLINVVENIDRYVNAITNLAEFLNSSADYVKMPWVINTMGFTDSIGLKLLTVILNLFKPTVLIEMKNATSKNNFCMDITSRNINTFQYDVDFQTWEHCGPNVSHDYDYFECAPYQELWKNVDKSFISRNINTRTERLLNVLAYFSEMTSLNCLSLLNVIPYFVSLNAIKISMNSLIVQDKYVANILNGRLVNLCIENNTLKKNTTNVYKLNAVPVESLGYGLVRGVDIDNQALYILTPVNGDLLNQVNLLVYAETLPECCSIFSVPHLPNDTLIPYTAPLRENAEHKNLHQVPRRKFNANRLLDIARKSSKI